MIHFHPSREYFSTQESQLLGLPKHVRQGEVQGTHSIIPKASSSGTEVYPSAQLRAKSAEEQVATPGGQAVQATPLR